MAILITIRDHISAHCDTADEAATILAGLAGAPLTAAVKRAPEEPKALPAPVKPRALPAPKVSAKPGPKPGSPGSVSTRILALLSNRGHWTVEEIALRVDHEPKQTRDLLGYLKRIGRVVRLDNGKWAAKGA